MGWIFGPIAGGMFFYSDRGAEAASQTIYIPYVVVAVIVLIIAAIFMVAPLPELNTEDAYAKEENSTGHHRSIWSHLHFPGAVVSQFLYVAAQAGIFSFFINYVVSDTPSLPDYLKGCWLIGGDSGSVRQDSGLSFLTEKGATKLLSGAFILFLAGRLVGAMLMRTIRAHTLLGVFALANVAMMILIFLKLGWISVVALFLSFFFMSIMFPTIFALGIWGLGQRAKIASSFIVMAIMGGAIMPKLMGWFSDEYGTVTGWYGRIMKDGGSDKLMSPGFIVPLFCFVVISAYGFNWSRLSGGTGEDISVKQGGH